MIVVFGIALVIFGFGAMGVSSERSLQNEKGLPELLLWFGIVIQTAGLVMILIPIMNALD